MKYLLTIALAMSLGCLFSQCNQHVFSSVGATEWTYFEYQDCDSSMQVFGIPTGGYTIIKCAELGTVFILNGDGWAYPLLTEHPNYPSCIQPPPCLSDLDGDGEVGSQDLLLLLGDYGTICD